LYKQNRTIQQRVLGAEAPDTANTTYNLACLAAMQGQPDRALALLEEAVGHGLWPYAAASMDNDVDLKSLHLDPRFAALVARAKKNAAAAQKS
jgi:hypothetical protein